MAKVISLQECRKVLSRHGWEIRHRIDDDVQYECLFRLECGTVFPQFKTLSQIRYLALRLLAQELVDAMDNPPDEPDDKLQSAALQSSVL